jgi:hypothetical protein
MKVLLCFELLVWRDWVWWQTFNGNSRERHLTLSVGNLLCQLLSNKGNSFSFNWLVRSTSSGGRLWTWSLPLACCALSQPLLDLPVLETMETLTSHAALLGQCLAYQKNLTDAGATYCLLNLLVYLLHFSKYVKLHRSVAVLCITLTSLSPE